MNDSSGARRSLLAALGLSAGAIVAFGLIMVLDRFTATAVPEPVVAIVSAERSLAPLGQYPGRDEGDWTAVSLPDTAPHRTDRDVQHAWYRIRFVLPEASSDLRSIVFQRPYAALQFWMNGTLMADSGVGRSPMPEYRTELRYNLSQRSLVGGENELLVLSVARTRPAGLSRIWIGDSRQMAAYKRERNWIEKSVPATLLQLIAILSLILLAFWIARPRETAFAWFAASLAMWAAHTWINIRSVPLFDSPLATRPTVLVSLIWFVTFSLLFTHRFVGYRQSKVEWAALAFAAGATATAYSVAAFAGHDHYRAVSLFLLVPGVLVVGALTSWRLLRAAMLSPRRREYWPLVPLAAALLVIGVRDWAADADWLGDWQSTSYLPYAAPLVFLIFGVLLIRRHAEALGVAEQLNLDLERKVAERTTEIAEAWQRLTELERERARTEERERWIRDMHDGVGGQLVQALALAERGAGREELQEVLRTSLDELRLVFDIGGSPPQPLGTSLGLMRERLQRRLRAIGIRLEWDFIGMPELPELGPERTMHVLRTVQELVSNAVNHAGAHRIAITCGRKRESGGDDIVIEVSDDGVGFDPSERGGGRGLANLERRAQALGGVLQWSSSPGAGTSACISFPSAWPPCTG